MLVIRTAKPSDAQAISALLHQLQHPSSVEHIQDQLTSTAAAHPMDVLVASSDEEVVGMLVLQTTPQFHEEPPLARIIDLCVLDTHQGRQIGRRLMEKAEQLARKNGCGKLEVTAGNFRKAAHQFYQRNGLEPTHRYFAKNL
jgi:GNAT superfamily N-acetyltransferase